MKPGLSANLSAIVTSLSATFALAACGQPRPVIVAPPAELATCALMPPAPDLPPQSLETQRERDVMTLDYILALRTAYADCASKVAGLAAWRAGVE